jgi:hypothetical protein
MEMHQPLDFGGCFGVDFSGRAQTMVRVTAEQN